MTRSWFSRLSLLWKVLLVTSLAITLLLGVTGWLVQRYAVRTTSQGLEDEVRSSLRVYESLWRSRTDMLASVSLILSNMSDVRAAFSTGDQATIRDTAKELWTKISREDAIFLVTDPQGIVVASLGGGLRLPELAVVRTAAGRFPAQAIGFMKEQGQLYQVVVTPVYVESQRGPALLNVLVAGYPVSSSLADTLKQSTGSDFLFSSNQSTIASTLDRQTTVRLAQVPVESTLPRPVRIGSAQYAVLTRALTDMDGRQLGELRIVRSFDSASRHLAVLQRNLIETWLVAVLVAIFLAFLLTRQIVGPIQRLDQAATEVARQNYDSRVPVETEDELGRLAVTFNGMCSSIREARDELIRQERLATIGHLSTSIVHDLRNPLAAIYGGSEMLVDGDLPPAQIRRLANNIYKASRRIQELLQDLLNISRGKVQSPEVCRIHDLVVAACEPLRASAQAQGVDIAINVPDTIEVSVERARIERVFFNLCSNSLEAMEDGGLINISGAQTNGAVLIRVEDTGPGISKELRSRLFQPFATAGKKNGLGLGLALSRQTVIAHGGDLWADTVPRGASLCVKLPAAKS